MKYFIFVFLLIIPSLYCLILDDGFLTRLQVSQDFGQNTFRMPKVVAFPTNVNEVVEAITYARKNNLTVIARGEGHNTYGYSLHDGMVIDQTLMKDIQILGYEAKVQCGVTMLELNHKLKTTNKIYANNPAYVGMTACGLISTQGIGAFATLEGSVSEYPTEITIVTASGKILTCNNNMNRDYFNVVRGGLGQHAVIVSATFPLKPRPLHMLVGYVQYHYQDFDSLIKGNILALERGYQNKATLSLNDPLVVSSGFFAEGVANGFVPDLSTPWILILEVNRFVNDQSSNTLDLTGFVGAIQTFSFQRTSYEDTYQPHYDSIQSGKELGNGLYYNPHLFTYYLVPYEQQKVVATLQLMSSFLNGLQVVDHMEILGMDRTKFRNPLNSIKFNNQKMFYITLINNANIPTPLSLVSTYTQANGLVYNASLIYDALVKIWGYGVISTVPYGYFPYSAEEHYGFEKFQQILRIKKRIDPQNIFSGGRNLFKDYFKDEPKSHYSQNDHDDHHSHQNDHDDHHSHQDDYHYQDESSYHSQQNENNSQHYSEKKK